MNRYDNVVLQCLNEPGACRCPWSQTTATHISQGPIESCSHAHATDSRSVPSFLASAGFLNGLRVVSLATSSARTDHVYIYCASITSSWPLSGENIHST